MADSSYARHEDHILLRAISRFVGYHVQLHFACNLFEAQRFGGSIDFFLTPESVNAGDWTGLSSKVNARSGVSAAMELCALFDFCQGAFDLFQRINPDLEPILTLPARHLKLRKVRFYLLCFFNLSSGKAVWWFHSQQNGQFENWQAGIFPQLSLGVYRHGWQILPPVISQSKIPTIPFYHADLEGFHYSKYFLPCSNMQPTQSMKVSFLSFGAAYVSSGFLL